MKRRLYTPEQIVGKLRDADARPALLRASAYSEPGVIRDGICKV